MTSNSCFIFHFMPEFVVESYSGYFSPSATDCHIEEYLSIRELLQKAFDKSAYSKEYPYNTDCLNIRCAHNMDEQYTIIEFAPREEEDQAYAVMAIILSVFEESRYYTIEESTIHSGIYQLYHTEVGRHSLLRQSWDHIPTVKEMIEAVSSLEIDCEKFAARIEKLQSDLKQAKVSYHDLCQRLESAEAPYRKTRIVDGCEQEYIDFDEWEATDEDCFFDYCSAEGGAFCAIQELDDEISRMQSYLQKKRQEHNTHI